MAPVFLNGRLHDWVSMIVSIGPPIGKVPATVQSATYPEHGQETTLQYGTGANPIGFTRDAYKPTQLMIEFLVAEWDSFRTLLGPGYGGVVIPGITFTFVDAAAGLVPRTDSFLNLTITKEQPTITQGTDPAKIQVTFQPTQMILNGVPYTLPTTVTA